MKSFPNVLLGLLVGTLVFQAKVDSLFWPLAYYYKDLTKLKSMLTVQQRQDALSFYRTDGNANIDYFLLTASLLVLLSLLGESIMAVQNSKRIYHVLSAVLFSCALILEIIVSRPLLSTLKSGIQRFT